MNPQIITFFALWLIIEIIENLFETTVKPFLRGDSKPQNHSFQNKILDEMSFLNQH